jgi:hypothetical protein
MAHSRELTALSALFVPRICGGTGNSLLFAIIRTEKTHRKVIIHL